MAVTIKREVDGVTLALSSLKNAALISISGINDLSNVKAYAGGKYGKALLQSASVAQKIFTMNFLINDQSGVDQTRFTDFMAHPTSTYLLNDTDRGLVDRRFQPDSTEDPNFTGDSVISVTATAEWGTKVTTTITDLYTGTFTTPGGFVGATGIAALNSGKADASIQLLLSTPTTRQWKANVELGFTSSGRSAKMITGAGQPNGTRAIWSGQGVGFDSWDDIVLGYGSWVPIGTQPFVLHPGEATSLAILPIADPMNAAAPATVTVKLRMVCVEQVIGS